MQNTQPKTKNKSLFFIDWLSFSGKFKVDFLKDSDPEHIFKFDTIELRPTHRRTPNFSRIYNIVWNNYPIGEIQVMPNKDFIDPDQFIFKYENQTLYIDGMINDIYKALRRCLSFDFIKINKLDIAHDQEESPEQTDYQYEFLANKIEFIGNQEITVQKKKSKIKYFRIGSRKSNKFVRCYYKRQELEVSNKKYISEAWKKNGLNEEREVYRTELSLSGSIMNKITAVNENDNTHHFIFQEDEIFKYIQEVHVLHAIFTGELKKFVKYVYTNELREKKRTNLCEQHTILECLKLEPIILLQRLKATATKVIHKLKMTSKFLHELFIETNNDIYSALSEKIANFEDLAKWRESKIERWTNEAQKRLLNKYVKKYIDPNQYEIENIYSPI